MATREFTDQQLRTLLSRADTAIAAADDARDFGDYLRDLLHRSGVSGEANTRYLREEESGDWFVLLGPGTTRWPEGMYEVAELDTIDGWGGAIADLIRETQGLAELRDSARHAAPGFFGRLFQSGRTAQARADATELDNRVTGIEGRQLVRRFEIIRQRVATARSTQSRGVRLFPGDHATPDHYREAATNALVKALKSRFDDDRDVQIIPFDPTATIAVLERARRLKADPNSETALRRQAEVLLERHARARAEVLLAELPVDALRSVTRDRLRTEGLDTIGVSTVADVLRSTSPYLRQVPGIGEQTANRLKAAAQTMLNEATASRSTTIGEEPTREATGLVTVLARYDALTDLDEVQRARRNRVLEYTDLIPETQAQVSLSATELGDWAVALSGDEHGNRLWQDFREDIAWADAHPTLLDLPKPGRTVADPWADYLTRPAHYQGLLATLLGRDDEGGSDLDPDTLTAIRGLTLDRTHLNEELHLRGYQSFGARFAVVQKRTILGDEMGLGKTVQALTAAAHVAATDGVATTRILVICPASVIVNWVREARAFTTLPVYRAHGNGKEDLIDAWRSDGGICALTFDGARTMVGELGAPEFVIVDEAHMIKNPQAQRSRAAVSLMSGAHHAMLLTGTPLENRVSDFATLVDYVAPGMFAPGDENLTARQFRTRIAPVYLRRNQHDVLDELPDKTEQIDWVDLTGPDQAHYADAVRTGNWMAMRRAPMTTPDAVPAKLERIREILDEARESGRKVLIFSFFLEVLDRLAEDLHRRGTPVIGVVDGSVAPTKRQEMIDRLGEADGTCVLLSQITAGGTGLNIQSATVVILVEPQVKPSIEAQAIARVHRMGQTSTVLVHRLVADDTADERLLDILGRKSQIFDAYARESQAAQVHDAVDVSEHEIARRIIAEEKHRLGL